MKKETHIWLFDKLISKDKCFECGNCNDTIHFHHVVPKSKGGTMAIPLCPKCHGLVHNRNFLHHKELQRLGIESAKKRGVYKGRNNGTLETLEQLISKPKNQEAIELLKEGKLKKKEIARIIGLHINTITKLVKVIKDNNL